MRLALYALIAAALAIGTPVPGSGTSNIRYGIQDDAWLVWGPGTLDERADRLRSMGVEVVRYTLAWSEIAHRRPADGANPRDPAYDWRTADGVLGALHRAGIAPVLTLYGTPGWANGDRAPNWAPATPSTFAAFARAAARRYPWVKLWLVWNEPNQRRWLRPTSPQTYVRTLLNPAYDAIHATTPGAKVGGGVTAPRASSGGVSPVRWIRGMGAARARLDAYAHNPYPLRPGETPFAGGCDHCETITMATLGRLLREVSSTFGPTRIWLTEYGYQTNPPDWLMGVSYARQARFLADASLRSYLAPRVDMLIHFLVQDEPSVERWQSGLLTVRGRAKPAFAAFALPLAQVSRAGTRVVVWGQVRPGSGPQAYRLQRQTGSGWQWIGGTARTSSRGFFRRSVAARPGTRVRLVAAGRWSPTLVVR